MVKPKDYLCTEDVEAGNPYEIWQRLQTSERALHPGDLLEALTECAEGASATASLLITKYIGFEPAEWLVPELTSNGVVVVVPLSVTEPEGCPS